jgi:hypothetical protein
MAAAMQWVGRVFGAALMMCLPGLAGQWLDGKLGTGFIAITGFALGLVASMAYLIGVTRQAEARRREARARGEEEKIEGDR